jgi:hypothetical protein
MYDTKKKYICHKGTKYIFIILSLCLSALVAMNKVLSPKALVQN